MRRLSVRRARRRSWCAPGATTARILAVPPPLPSSSGRRSSRCMRCASPAPASRRIRFTCARPWIPWYSSLNGDRRVDFAVAVEVDVRAVFFHRENERRLEIPPAPFLVLHAELDDPFAVDSHHAEEWIRAGVVAPAEPDARADDHRRLRHEIGEAGREGEPVVRVSVLVGFGVLA